MAYGEAIVAMCCIPRYLKHFDKLPSYVVSGYLRSSRHDSTDSEENRLNRYYHMRCGQVSEASRQRLSRRMGYLRDRKPIYWWVALMVPCVSVNSQYNCDLDTRGIQELRCAKDSVSTTPW